MTRSAPRTLISIRRAVPPAAEPEYSEAWSAVRRAAEAGGAHAWRFVSASEPGRHLEFLEFAADADPRTGPDLPPLLRRLDDIAAGEAEEWAEE